MRQNKERMGKESRRETVRQKDGGGDESRKGDAAEKKE